MFTPWGLVYKYNFWGLPISSALFNPTVRWFTSPVAATTGNVVVVVLEEDEEDDDDELVESFDNDFVRRLLFFFVGLTGSPSFPPPNN